MGSVSSDLPARRAAWLADTAYQVRLLEQARTLVAAAVNVNPTRLVLDAASMPDTHENVQLADRDEVKVRFTFRLTEVTAEQGAHHRGRRRAA